MARKNENAPAPSSLETRVAELENRLAEAERVIKAQIEAIDSIEKHTNADHMPSGEYYAAKFS